jgi:hypothetical protein
MSQLNNVMDILKLLDKTNCKACGEATCLAFAAAVLKGARELQECTHLEQDVIDRYAGKTQKRRSIEQDARDAMEALKGRIAGIDLSEAALRTGGRCANGKLIIKIMGKDFTVDDRGNLASEIHVNSWVAVPLLNYVLHAKGTDDSGNWIPFRELPGGREMAGLFVQRCEKPLKKVADTYTGLFEDMLNIFNGKQVERHFDSDISLVLRPLPKVPILICYWRPDDGLESDLNIFFDAATPDNLPFESIYALAAGLVTMFEKIAQRHGEV